MRPLTLGNWMFDVMADLTKPAASSVPTFKTNVNRDLGTRDRSAFSCPSPQKPSPVSTMRLGFCTGEDFRVSRFCCIPQHLGLLFHSRRMQLWVGGVVFSLRRCHLWCLHFQIGVHRRLPLCSQGSKPSLVIHFWASNVQFNKTRVDFNQALIPQLRLVSAFLMSGNIPIPRNFKIYKCRQHRCRLHWYPLYVRPQAFGKYDHQNLSWGSLYLLG